ncbi:NADP-dependent oxidoreductase [Micromonospora sp. MS34]|uniref:NADP-dependent oxidoreductase n=1 Tax=Micromonospora sp. MS34 TaxID=3385971 RepID=UPI00399FD834
MRAVVVDSPGPSDSLRVRDLGVSDGSGGCAVVAVAAAGVDPVDAGNRADPSWAGVEPPYVVGYEFAGDVTSIETDGTDLRVGDRVWGLLPVRGTRWGAYAEQVTVPHRFLARRPSALSAIEAAALPLAGATALQTLDRLALSRGGWLLVHGAAGGVGHLLVQLAVARGIRVAAASRPADRRRLIGLGVELWLDRAGEPVPAAAAAELGRGVDGVVDLVGGQLAPSLPYVVEGGCAATIVDLEGDLNEAVDRNISIHGVLLRPGREVLDRLSAAVDAGLRPDVRHVWPLAEAAEAHRRLEAGGVGGKIVLSVRG